LGCAEAIRKGSIAGQNSGTMGIRKISAFGSTQSVSFDALYDGRPDLLEDPVAAVGTPYSEFKFCRLNRRPALQTLIEYTRLLFFLSHLSRPTIERLICEFNLCSPVKTLTNYISWAVKVLTDPRRQRMAHEILILAGGGGHTGYAYALAQALYGKAPLSFLVPEGDELSKKRMSKFGDVDSFIKPRGPKTSTFRFAVRLARAFAKSTKKVPRKVSAVVSTGSNFCIPPALTAWFKGMPIINIESSVRFTKASKTAKILQPFSDITALQWEEQKNLLNDGTVVGPLLPKPEIEPWNGGYILVTGGTYGHRLLFDTMKESSATNVILQTGRVDPEPYIQAHPEWKVVTLTAKFHELLAGAGVVVTHFGSTVLDALIYQKPIVLVPNPEWTRTAGMEDAEFLARKVNAVLVSEVTLRSLLDAIEEARKREVSTFPSGAENLASKIIELLGAS